VLNNVHRKKKENGIQWVRGYDWTRKQNRTRERDRNMEHGHQLILG
jgi:hypothetical protein